MSSFMKNAEMMRFIDQAYRTPYSLLTNNCFHKSIKIVRKADELGLEANLVIAPVSITPRHTSPYLPRILPHCYSIIERHKVDVALDPATEKIWCKNNEIISLLPMNLKRGVWIARMCSNKNITKCFW